jgi:hypothetical protein
LEAIPLRAWRGIIVKKASPVEAAQGISWTTDRDCAAWFAMRFFSTESNLRPFVFCAEFEPTAIVCLHDDRSESEVIVDLTRVNHRSFVVDHDGTKVSDLKRMSKGSDPALASWRDSFDAINNHR